MIIMKKIWWFFRSNDKRDGLEFVRLIANPLTAGSECSFSLSGPRVQVCGRAFVSCRGGPQLERIDQTSLLSPLAVCLLYRVH